MVEIFTKHAIFPGDGGEINQLDRIYKERKFDVLISDMNIERAGDGFTVVSAMRSAQPNAVRLILTGYPAIETALQALREGVDDYLIKPSEIEDIVAKIKSKMERGARRPEIKPKRLSEIIKRERGYITEKWLELAKQDADLSRINLPDAERKDHVPRLLDVAVGIFEGNKITAENKFAAAQHGKMRIAQGYLAAWLVREASLLQDAIAACIHCNVLEIQISTLIPDMVRVFGIVQSLLEESLSAFLVQRPQRTVRKR